MEYVFNDIKKICTQWGYWATPRLGTEYPSISISIPIPIDESKRRICQISDDLALQIEQCLLVMSKVTPDLYDLFMATYAYRLPLHTEFDRDYIPVKIGLLERFGISKAQYFIQIRIAETSLKLMLSQNKCIFLA
ncbi:antiterminator Q family protein [Gallibacterium salpingitidis]|uniref:antiterminator Q family protein n=1 Tax=Gallibacterium salpingitidis TaxID=505341 RepID=UPI0026703B4D|nr:antiterminator Q family protein [Gallibacterium salpingitidis]WKS98754.1 antiterminator Q family protein [Gallibacterium salpingitidis]